MDRKLNIFLVTASCFWPRPEINPNRANFSAKNNDFQLLYYKHCCVLDTIWGLVLAHLLKALFNEKVDIRVIATFHQDVKIGVICST